MVLEAGKKPALVFMDLPHSFDDIIFLIPQGYLEQLLSRVRCDA